MQYVAVMGYGSQLIFKSIKLLHESIMFSDHPAMSATYTRVCRAKSEPFKIRTQAPPPPVDQRIALMQTLPLDLHSFLVSLPSSRLNVHVNQTVRRSKASGLNSKTSLSSRVCLLTRCEMKVKVVYFLWD